MENGRDVVILGCHITVCVVSTITLVRPGYPTSVSRISSRSLSMTEGGKPTIDHAGAIPHLPCHYGYLLPSTVPGVIYHLAGQSNSNLQSRISCDDSSRVNPQGMILPQSTGRTLPCWATRISEIGSWTHRPILSEEMTAPFPGSDDYSIL